MFKIYSNIILCDSFRKIKLATNKLRPKKDKSDISLSFRFLKECSLSENVLILSFLKKESNINRTFNLPNFTDRIPQGAGSRGGVGAYIAERLPNITGNFIGGSFGLGIVSATGAFTAVKTTQDDTGTTGNAYNRGPYNAAFFNANTSSAVYQDNAPVQQAATVVNFCIRY